MQYLTEKPDHKENDNLFLPDLSVVKLASSDEDKKIASFVFKN